MYVCQSPGSVAVVMVKCCTAHVKYCNGHGEFGPYLTIRMVYPVSSHLGRGELPTYVHDYPNLTAENLQQHAV